MSILSNVCLHGHQQPLFQVHYLLSCIFSLSGVVRAVRMKVQGCNVLSASCHGGAGGLWTAATTSLRSAWRTWTMRTSCTGATPS